MRKTLLLVFIHGFKGSDETFLSFPRDLTASLSLQLPNITITPFVFPTFETRGDLESTVRRFREWLTDKVVDIEVSLGTQNPMLKNGVRVVILGHSMGGIVGAEAVLAIAGKTPTVASKEAVKPAESAAQVGAQEGGVKTTAAGTNTPIGADSKEDDKEEGDIISFPHIVGLLAFDTPYLGLAPSMISHGAETHWNTGKGIFDTASTLWGSMRNSTPSAPAVKAPAGALPAPSAGDAAAASASAGGWGKIGLFGAAAAGLAGAAGAAYYNRQAVAQGVGSATAGLTSGWTWVSSHLEFVGCLAKAEELQRRLAAICAMAEVKEEAVGVQVQKRGSDEARTVEVTRKPLGFGQFYTVLGKGADRYSGGAKASGNEDRRFCNMPRSDALKSYWKPARNDIAKDEVTAHMTIFEPDNNPDYYQMTDRSRDLLVKWIDTEWYGSSTPDEPEDVEMTE